MKKIILAPDSFKGTISSLDICNIMKEAALRSFPDCQVISIPVADGGEGTVDSMLAAAGGEKIHVAVKGPRMTDIESFYGRLPDGKTAVIEMAAAAGLPMVKGSENPMDTTTYGVGMLIDHALQNGATNILLGLGGSCTNDGGCGAAAALGVRFMDEEGTEFLPRGGDLARIAAIDLSPVQKKLEGVQIRIMCDVNNPLWGESGAAYVFGPQKGADEEMVRMLDHGLRVLGGLLEDFRPGVETMAGAGAAGGMGAGMCAMLGAELVSGIDGVLDTVGFDGLLEGCDMVFTGEGRIDGQSLRGKVIFGICRRAKAAGVPVCAVVGDALDEQLEEARERGLCAVFTTNRRAMAWEKAKPDARKYLTHTVNNLFAFAAALKK
ncbi:MAG: glycerate kinase [Clostridia bacterium]|nr:glycerate kinase [Clostridia bacterium]